MRQKLRFLLTVPGIGSGSSSASSSGSASSSASGRAVLGPDTVAFAETKSYFIS